MSDPVKVVAIFIAKPGKTEELGALLCSVAKATQADQGVIFYHLHQDVKEPRRFVFFESWSSQADIDLHDATAHIAALREKLPALIEHGEVNNLKQIH
jgi:quinol monooxygenase YgiN